ncbi:hypothetical protein EJ03DRAFT_99358 [Teratosphaeria nubilosa]|uniref:Uncharacterized protein n=1 Tax=Teratosphaeria nubilosa TaxID=161662 RepID=A0A6G1L947_9PEZI|nr:hypothetical protein EJ03DRAFT_99358 [Teratosphaeria nubilosa]
MSIFSGQASYIDDSFGSVYAHVEDETASEVSGINGPRSGRWSVSTRNSRYSEIDDRTPTVWNESTAWSNAGQSQAHRQQSALDANLLRKLAAVTLEEKAQAARLVQGPEPGGESVVVKHLLRAPSVVEQERPKGFFLPPNIKPRQISDKHEPKPEHQHATVCAPPSVHSYNERASRAAQDGPVKQSRGRKKIHITGKGDEEIILQLPHLPEIPAAFNHHSRKPAPAPIASRDVSPKRELDAVCPAASPANDKEYHGRLQEVECYRTEVARAAAKALMSGALPTPDNPASFKPSTPPKHAWVESVHSSSKDSGVGFGGLGDDAPPASAHSRHSAAPSVKSLRDAVKQITANNNASRSMSQALQTSVKQTASAHFEKPASVQGSGYLNIFEQTPSQSVHSMQHSVASKKSLRDAVKHISANSESVKASNGGWADALQQDVFKARSAEHSDNGWDGNTPASRHSTKPGNDGWDDTNQRVSSKSRSVDQSDHGWDGNAPASRHSTRVSKSGREEGFQQNTSDTRSARHSNNGWEDHVSNVKQSTKGSISGWKNDGFGAMFEEKAASHYSSRRSRISGNIAEAVRHISGNSDRQKAHGANQAHRSLSQDVCGNGGWAQNSGSHKGSAPASRANSGSQKNGDGGSEDAIGLGGIFEEPAASRHSSRASEMSKEELVDAIIQARTENRQEASNGGWHEIGQGWTQGHASVRSTARQSSVAKSGQEEAAGGLAGEDGWGASVHNSGGSNRSSKPSRISIAAPDEGPTIFAGGGWISPHPLSEASMPQERIVLPAEYAKAVAGGIEKNEMTYEDWKAVQRSASAAEPVRSRPESDRSSHRDGHSSRHSDRSIHQRAGQGLSHGQSGSRHSDLTEAAAARYQAELDAIVQKSPPASVVKDSKAGVELKMPWD